MYDIKGCWLSASFFINLNCQNGRDLNVKKVIKTIENVYEAGTILIVFGLLIIFFLRIYGIDTFIVRSGSMEPAIWTGSMCFVDKRIEYDDIAVDDIVAFKRGKLLVTHRVVNITEEGFVTKGDNNDMDDGVTTTKDNYIGKTIFAVPKMGYIVGWLQSKQGKILVAIYVCGLLALQWILPEGIAKGKVRDKK